MTIHLFPLALLCGFVFSPTALAGPPVPTPTPYNYPAREYIAGTRYAVIEYPPGHPVGDISASFQKSGAFSARLQLGGFVRHFSGRTNANGDWPADYVDRTMMIDGTPFNVRFGWVSGGDGPEYSFSVDSPSGLVGTGGVFKATLPSKAARPLNGRFTARISGGSTLVPNNGGFASIASTGGVLTGAGFLPDGRAFTFSAPILEDWSWAGFKPGYLAGDAWSFGATFGSEDAFSGEFRWERTQAAKPQDPPLKETREVIGARHTKDPTRSFPGIHGPWQANLSAWAVDGLPAFEFTMPVGRSSWRFDRPWDDVTWANFTWNKTTGVFNGSFRSSGKLHTYRGVVLGPGGFGYGLVLRPGPVRDVTLRAMETAAGPTTGGGGGTVVTLQTSGTTLSWDGSYSFNVAPVVSEGSVEFSGGRDLLLITADK